MWETLVTVNEDWIGIDDAELSVAGLGLAVEECVIRDGVVLISPRDW